MEVRIPEMQELAREVHDLKDIVVRLLATSKEGTLTVSVLDIARMEGVAPSQLYQGGKERYLLPRFGESAYPTGTTRWPLEEYLEYRKLDPEERKAAWLRHLREQKDRRLACSEGSTSTTRRRGTR